MPPVTFIAALKPKVAFILDIRRGNLVVHLMYKALFEMSSDRADFLSRLFSRKRPDGLTATSSVAEMMSAFNGVAPSEELYQATFKAVSERLTKTHGFALHADDLDGIYEAIKENALLAKYAGGKTSVDTAPVKEE